MIEATPSTWDRSYGIFVTLRHRETGGFLGTLRLHDFLVAGDRDRTHESDRIAMEAWAAWIAATVNQSEAPPPENHRSSTAATAPGRGPAA
jgi:hypothetical protein